jgi:hypothetical protein
MFDLQARRAAVVFFVIMAAMLEASSVTGALWL